MGRRKLGGGSKPSAEDARLERQARELRANLKRRKAQSRARLALGPKPPEPGNEDGDDA